jgi:hypothetical protein
VPSSSAGGGKVSNMFPPFSISENEANAELNLARSVDRGECPSDVIGEIPSRILKNGVSVSAEGERGFVCCSVGRNWDDSGY